MRVREYVHRGASYEFDRFTALCQSLEHRLVTEPGQDSMRERVKPDGDAGRSRERRNHLRKHLCVIGRGSEALTNQFDALVPFNDPSQFACGSRMQAECGRSSDRKSVV